MMLKLCTYFKWNIVYDIIDRRNDLFLFTKRAQSELIFPFTVADWMFCCLDYSHKHYIFGSSEAPYFNFLPLFASCDSQEWPAASLYCFTALCRRELAQLWTSVLVAQCSFGSPMTLHGSSCFAYRYWLWVRKVCSIAGFQRLFIGRYLRPLRSAGHFCLN